MTDSKTIVYIVDDDLSVGKALGRLLKSWGYSYKIFTSAESFLAGADLKAVSCLVLDIMLPGMDGMELQQKMKQLECNIPIVFITGHGDEDMERKAMDAGAYGYLDKPFDDRLLKSMIDNALQSSSSY